MLYEEELLIFFRFFHLLGNLFLGMNYFFMLLIFKVGNLFGWFLQQFLYELFLRVIFYSLLYGFFKIVVVLKDVLLGSFLNKDGRLLSLLSFS